MTVEPKMHPERWNLAPHGLGYSPCQLPFTLHTNEHMQVPSSTVNCPIVILPPACLNEEIEASGKLRSYCILPPRQSPYSSDITSISPLEPLLKNSMRPIPRVERP
ncbi:hypothetical protein TIFTF001_045346 [Ficus carica]|uniref:Uncharacterized protein n=1 Tax=Ficus carica TaxID=3494 RepID=A0AA87YYV0_FICCA|nr:hypothetical protein TIFTF001_045346 [Ficus carica]